MEHLGTTQDQFDVIELNEAFALFGRLDAAVANAGAEKQARFCGRG